MFDNERKCCPCPDHFHPPDKDILHNKEDPESCYLDCDLKCFEEKFKHIVEEEEF
jgi:hypothetical protein